MMKRIVLFPACVLLLACAPPPPARAADAEAAGAEAPPAEVSPLWEFGVFGGAARLPHYRGSDEYKEYVLPLPYLIYRGKVFRSNREGVRSIFWENDRFETGVSLSGNPPVDDDNSARRGMPELGAIVEVGPLLKCHLNGRENPDPFYATLALRGAISVDTGDLDTAWQGTRGEVKLVYRNYTAFEKRDLHFGFNAGADFADREGNQYFYEVEPDYATADRPAYSPGGGYAGFSLSANATKELNRRLSLGIYYRWDNLSGTAYADSPLVKTENNHVFGFALIWNIRQSKTPSPYSTD